MSNIICGTFRKQRIFYFWFDRDTNIITIQPKKMMEYDSWFSDDYDLFPYFKDYIDVDGETNKHNYIKFIKIKFYGIGRGCFQAWVPAYIEGTANEIYPIPKPNKIKKMIFSGKAIDLFIQSNRIVKDITNTKEKIITATINYSDENKISFQNNKQTYNFYPTWTRNINKDINNILVINSSLCIVSEKNMKLEDILKNYEEIEKFMCFTNYRKHVVFDKIVLIQEEAVDYFGKVENVTVKFYLHIASRKDKYDLAENNKVILIDDIIDNIDKVFTNVIEADFLMQSLPVNKEEKNIIDIAKYINISSSFESEMDKMLPNFKATIKEKYKYVQNDICDYIKKQIDNIESKKSKEKGYYEDILDSITKLNGRLEEKINYALKKYNYIIESDIKFYKKLYNLDSINLNELATSFSKKRNYLSHGYSIESFDKNEIMSYVMIKKICYAMILERSGISNEKIKSIIEKIY